MDENNNNNYNNIRKKYVDFFENNNEDVELIIVVLYDNSIDADVMTTLSNLDTARILFDAAKKILSDRNTYQAKDLN